MQIPENLRYTKNHEWVQVEGKKAKIGVTFHAQTELGDVVYVDIDRSGQALSVGSVFGTIEAVKTVSDLFMPVAGTIVSVNEELEAHPELVNSDPYGSGWMIEIELQNPKDLEQLMDASAYRESIAEE